MNKTNAHLYLPLVRDLAAGLAIQVNRGTVDAPMWVYLDADDGEVAFTCPPHLYRVGPKRRARSLDEGPDSETLVPADARAD